jgi:2-phosphosulfolactate phosphatase
MSKKVRIESFDAILPCGRDYGAIVAVDVVRATTTAVTAMAMGRACYVAPTIPLAFELAAELQNPLMAGEHGGIIPAGFAMGNSPADVAQHNEVNRPLILVSSSGTRLCFEAAKYEVALIACLRNFSVVAKYISRFDNVSLIGAATHGEFREEDQLCCAWIAASLCDSGYSPATPATTEIIRRWENKAATAWLNGNSAAFLRRTGKVADLEFILEHIEDVDSVYALKGAKIVDVNTEHSAMDYYKGADRVAS